MKTKNKKLTDSILEKISSILKGYGAKKIAIFGSFSRGEAGDDSDLDILVEFKDQKSLFELVEIEMELTEKLKIKVDLLTYKSISPYMIDRIKEEEKIIYQ